MTSILVQFYTTRGICLGALKLESCNEALRSGREIAIEARSLGSCSSCALGSKVVDESSLSRNPGWMRGCGAFSFHPSQGWGRSRAIGSNCELVTKRNMPCMSVAWPRRVHCSLQRSGRMQGGMAGWAYHFDASAYHSGPSDFYIEASASLIWR
jgi:hypothetical protein